MCHSMCVWLTVSKENILTISIVACWKHLYGTFILSPSTFCLTTKKLVIQNVKWLYLVFYSLERLL